MFVHRRVVGVPILEILRNTAGIFHPNKLELCCPRLVIHMGVCGKDQPRE